jgi:hypothetical protein
LPSEVFIVKVANEKRLGRKGIRLHIHISPSDFVDEGRLSNVGVAADEECTCVGVDIGKTGYVLSHLLKVRQGVFLSPHDCCHAVCNSSSAEDRQDTKLTDREQLSSAAYTGTSCHRISRDGHSL